MLLHSKEHKTRKQVQDLSAKSLGIYLTNIKITAKQGDPEKIQLKIFIYF